MCSQGAVCVCGGKPLVLPSTLAAAVQHNTTACYTNTMYQVKDLLCGKNNKSSITRVLGHRHGKGPSPGGKYTALPTSIHETVMHQD